MYAVKCTSGCKAGKYLAKPGPQFIGRHDPYTTDIEEVQLFHTTAEADAARCPENEIVVPIK